MTIKHLMFKNKPQNQDVMVLFTEILQNILWSKCLFTYSLRHITWGVSSCILMLNCVLKLQLNLLHGPRLMKHPHLSKFQLKQKSTSIILWSLDKAAALRVTGGLQLALVNKDYCLAPLTCPTSERDI